MWSWESAICSLNPDFSRQKVALRMTTQVFLGAEISIAFQVPDWRCFRCAIPGFALDFGEKVCPEESFMVTAFENAVNDQAENARRALAPEQCALIVVDIQEKLLPPIFQKEQLVRNAKLLIQAAGVLKIPAIVSTQYAKGLGGIVAEIASLLPETEAIDKHQFSCFGSEGFCTLLKRLPGNRNTLLLCGMESHICVAQTALAALREGYLVHIASDAVSSRTEWNWKIGLERMRAAGAVISSTEMIIYELMRSSSSAAFKEMLPHLKG
jgi:nicotinamidase-related amidase